MGLWVVEPAVTRLDLGGDAWIEVKRELTYGEAQELAGMALRVQGGMGRAELPSLQLHWAEFQIETIYRWLTGWSATDAQGKAIPVSREAIRALPQAMAARLDAAIREHILAVEHEKN